MQHVAAARLSANARTSSPTTPGASVTSASVSSARRSAAGRSDSSGSRSLGRPRWETSTSRAPRVAQLLDRRQRRADPGVVRDRAVLERDVEVDPDQHPLVRRRRPGPPVSSQQPLHEVSDAVGVSPLVVVPGDDLDHRPVHHRSQLRVEDRRRRVLDDVRGDDRILGVEEQMPFSGPLGGGCLQRRR